MNVPCKLFVIIPLLSIACKKPDSDKVQLLTSNSSKDWELVLEENQEPNDTGNTVTFNADGTYETGWNSKYKWELIENATKVVIKIWPDLGSPKIDTFEIIELSDSLFYFARITEKDTSYSKLKAHIIE